MHHFAEVEGCWLRVDGKSRRPCGAYLVSQHPNINHQLKLKRPGSKLDVETGAAVFTFAGLGPSRVWKLPKCPIFCEWPSLKDYPFEGQNGSFKTNLDDYGYVCQAEELQVNGQWKRYFGFVC